MPSLSSACSLKGISRGTWPRSAERMTSPAAGHVGNALVLQHGDLHGALAVDDVGGRQVAQARLADHELAKLGLVAGDLPAASSRSRAMLTMSVRITWPCSSR